MRLSLDIGMLPPVEDQYDPVAIILEYTHGAMVNLLLMHRVL